MNIRTKLNLTITFVVFILATSLMIIVYFSMITHFENQEGNRLEDHLIHSAKVIDDFMFTRVKDFNNLSNNPLFGESSNKISSDYLSRILEQYPFYKQIYFVNNYGIILSSTEQQQIGANILDIESDIEEEFYKTVNGGQNDVYISDISNVSQKEIDNNLPYDIELLSDVVDLEGNTIGVLVGLLNVKLITEIVSENDKHTIGNEFASLVDKQGNILISSNPKASILGLHPNLAFKELHKNIKAGENGFLIYENSKGIKVISAYADLSEYGTEEIGNWTLLITSPYDIVMVPIYDLLFNMFIAISLLLFFVIVIIYFISKSISKPIIDLEHEVSNIRIGSKPTKFKETRTDEVGKLSKSFNLMTENLYNAFEEKRLVENELRDNEVELKELNESKDKFFSIIAHDLRSPFNSMLGFSKLLVENFDDFDTEKKKKFIGIIDEELENTFNLIENLLLWSRSQKGVINFISEKLNLYLISEETKELLKQSAKNKRIKLKNKIPENIFVDADKYMISTIFRNLISNAIKFTPNNGEISINAKLTSYNNAKYAEITIKDNGIGIPKKLQPQLFNIGKITSTKGTKNEKGTGLGLILCKEFIEKHGGKIWVLSEVDKGSEFKFTIPISSSI